MRICIVLEQNSFTNAHWAGRRQKARGSSTHQPPKLSGPSLKLKLNLNNQTSIVLVLKSQNTCTPASEELTATSLRLRFESCPFATFKSPVTLPSAQATAIADPLFLTAQSQFFGSQHTFEHHGVLCWGSSS
jgi:hypothetical protein